ncbi:hypothetical protein U4E84_03375 [Halorubrum sp. AD140]|uniref:hypothetical protein n=1 Tax=Halorubrum sp. AD140 TaxID=3050073 RepID=UPI002ACC81E7|nr:hypothetical protein [Halorubrum sp. AD140]MDZ5810393.1 hypothetical protein [Halorubrum sp. AD140]
MNRRSYLAGVSAAGLLAGCTDALVLGDAGASPRDPPERPADLTPESVAPYVADYEEVRAHSRHASEGATDVSVDAVATFDHAANGDHYATAQHAGTVSREDDGDRTVGELYSDPVPYLVASDRTLRLSVERRRVEAAERERTGDETTSPPLGVRLLNVTDEPREIAVTVVRRSGPDDGNRSGGEDDGGDAEGADDGTVLSTTVDVGPETAIELLGITGVRGGYRVVAEMEDNGVTGQGRIEVGLPSADREPNVDVVVDDVGVSTRHLPSFDGV